MKQISCESRSFRKFDGTSYTTPVALFTVELVPVNKVKNIFKMVCLTKMERALWSPLVAVSTSTAVSSMVGVWLSEGGTILMEARVKTIDNAWLGLRCQKEYIDHASGRKDRSLLPFIHSYFS